MKSERRHELQHNDLADWFISTYERALPYRNLILGLTLLVIVSAISYSFWRSSAQTQAADSWNAVEIREAMVLPVFRFPQYATTMEGAVKAYGGTPAGQWAQICLADSVLYFGEEQLLKQKDVGQQNLKNALDIYSKALSAKPDAMATERAMFGKARALESLGNLQEALTAYTDLNKAFPQGTYKAIADQRLERLSKPDTVEFYKALAQYSPKTKKEPEKTSAGPANKLENLSLPENPEGSSAAPKSSGSVAAPKSSGEAAAPSIPELPPTPTVPEPPSTPAK